MFHSWGKTKFFYTKRAYYLSILICLGTFILGLQVDRFATVLWFFSIGIFTHIMGHRGQFVAERYTVLANVGFCILIGKVLTGPAFWIVTSIYFCISWAYIKAWRHNEDLFTHSMRAFPDAPENYVNLSSYYMERKRYHEAIRPLEVAMILSKGRKYGLYKNLANCYHMAGLYGKAIACLTAAMKEAPKNEVGLIQGCILDVKNKIVRINKNRKKIRKMGVV